MTANPPLIPVYTTRGDVGAFLVYPYLYDRDGKWIGWVAPDRGVFSVRGKYVGWLSNDARILRKPTQDTQSTRQFPAAPGSLRPPAVLPLAPLMGELKAGIQDVLQDDPDLLSPVEYGDLGEDLD